LIQDTIAHFIKVDGVDVATFARHSSEAFARWCQRSAATDWSIDGGVYAELVHEVEETRARRKTR